MPDTVVDPKIEVTEPKTNASAVQPTAPAQVIDPAVQAQQAEAILKRVEADPRLLDDPVLKDYYDKAKEMAGEKKEEPEAGEKKEELKKEEPKKEEPKGEDPKKEEPKKEEPEGGEKKEDPKKEGDDEESIFLDKGKQPPKIENMDEFTKFIKENHSIDDVQTFLQSASKWRTDAQNKAEIEKSHENLSDALSKLPEGLYDAVQAHWQGRNWEEALDDGGGRIDFSLNFTQHDEGRILNRYYSDRIDGLQDRLEKEELTADEFDDKIQDLYSSALPLYEKDQQNWTAQRNALVESQEKLQEQYKDSVTVSVDNLKTEIPGFSSDKHKSKLDAVRNILARNQVADLFFTKEGLLKPDAAKLIFYAKFGEEESKRLIGMAENRGKSKANEEYVDAAPKGPGGTKNTSDDTAVATQRKALEQLLKGKRQVSSNPLEHIPKD